MSSSSAPRGPPRRPPRLPASAFAPPPVAPRRLYPQAILDSHIHLWTSQQLAEGHIVWPQKVPNVLGRGEHSLDGEYASVVTRGVEMVNRAIAMKGCVYVQAEVVHDDQEKDGSGGGWKSSIDEVDQVCKSSQRSNVKALALCPWAPVHLGPCALEAYIPLVTAVTTIPITAFRFLLQDMPRGFYLSPDFISGLAYLGSSNYAFDMTLDSRRGSWMLEEAVECISTLRSQGSEVKIILDHFGKPDLSGSMSTSSDNQAHADWVRSIYQLALLPEVYLKLSGLLDVCDPETVRKAASSFTEEQKPVEERRDRAGGDAYKELKERIKKVVEPVLEAFGDSRIMIGSDWPMFRACTISSEGHERDEIEEAAAWGLEMKLYLDVLIELGLEGEALDRIFERTAKEVYQIQ